MKQGRWEKANGTRALFLHPPEDNPGEQKCNEICRPHRRIIN